MAASKRGRPKKIKEARSKEPAHKPEKIKETVQPIEEPKQEEEKKETPKYEGPVCECGDPVAPGQTYVCQKHMRWN